MSHPRLLSPLSLRGQTLRNRIVFGAHTANMSEKGLPGPRNIRALPAGTRASGGAGMIVCRTRAGPPVTGVLTRGNYLLSGSDAIIAGFSES